MRHDLCSSTTVSAGFVDCGCAAYGASCVMRLSVFHFKLHRSMNLACRARPVLSLCNTSTDEGE